MFICKLVVFIPVSSKSYQSIGCFNSSVAIGNNTITYCADDAWNIGLPVFGVKFSGECWSGRLGNESYSVDGNATSGCWEGLGGSEVNYVFAFDRKYQPF